MAMAFDNQAPTTATTPAETSSGAAQHATSAATARIPRPAPERVGRGAISAPSNPVGTDAATRREMFAVLFGQFTALLQDSPHPSVRNSVRHLAAGTLGFDEAAPPQTREVVRDLALSNPERVNELRDSPGPFEEQLEDGETGGVSQDAKEASRRSPEVRIQRCRNVSHAGSIQQENPIGSGGEENADGERRPEPRPLRQRREV
jgi:hypothetical protein